MSTPSKISKRRVQFWAVVLIKLSDLWAPKDLDHILGHCECALIKVFEFVRTDLLQTAHSLSSAKVLSRL